MHLPAKIIILIVPWSLNISSWPTPPSPWILEHWSSSLSCSQSSAVCSLRRSWDHWGWSQDSLLEDSRLHQVSVSWAQFSWFPPDSWWRMYCHNILSKLNCRLQGEFSSVRGGNKHSFMKISVKCRPTSMFNWMKQWEVVDRGWERILVWDSGLSRLRPIHQLLLLTIVWSWPGTLIRVTLEMTWTPASNNHSKHTKILSTKITLITIEWHGFSLTFWYWMKITSQFSFECLYECVCLF